MVWLLNQQPVSTSLRCNFPVRARMQAFVPIFKKVIDQTRLSILGVRKTIDLHFMICGGTVILKDF